MVDAHPGDTVQWLVAIVNGGDEPVHGVVGSVALAPHLTAIPSTAKWYSASQHGVPFDIDQFFLNHGANGYIFGNYAPNGDLLVRFDTYVGGGYSTCAITVRTTAHAESAEHRVASMDGADVRITKERC